MMSHWERRALDQLPVVTSAAPPHSTGQKHLDGLAVLRRHPRRWRDKQAGCADANRRLGLSGVDSPLCQDFELFETGDWMVTRIGSSTPMFFAKLRKRPNTVEVIS
ncbi:hypothetical protein ES703_30577 [subsurface metagenome]